MENLKQIIKPFNLKIYKFDNRFFVIKYNNFGIRFDSYILFSLTKYDIINYIKNEFNKYGVDINIDLSLIKKENTFKEIEYKNSKIPLTNREKEIKIREILTKKNLIDN